MRVTESLYGGYSITLLCTFGCCLLSPEDWRSTRRENRSRHIVATGILPSCALFSVHRISQKQSMNTHGGAYIERNESDERKFPPLADGREFVEAHYV